MERTETLERDRLEVLAQLEDWLEVPMIVLSFVWLVLLVVELVWGLIPLLDIVGLIIWGAFVVDFVLRFTLAPRKLPFLRSNWLTAVSLMLPALRLLRVLRLLRLLRAARAARGLRLVRVVGSLNRGMRATRASMRRRHFGYVLTFTLIILVVGAAGMFAFEREVADDGRGLETYGDALWWTAMLLTTLGSEYWPQTPEGRVLCVVLSLYGFAVFGYVTATLASIFVGQDADSEEGEVAGAKEVAALQAEIRALRAEVEKLTR